jgi:4-amino-4-deoxy-L-arabinose transferase-like glycosyltransferase
MSAQGVSFRLELPSSKARLWLCLFCLLALSPSLGKALHIDDPLFVWAAEQLVRAPDAPYRFLVNWYDTLQPFHEVMQNPPLTSAVQALILGLSDGSLLALRVVFLLLATLAALGVFELAREYGAPPLLAGLFTLGTPVFLINAGSLMSEPLLLCLWLWSLTLWLRGTRAGRAELKLAAALLLGLAGLTKYSGICLAPLLLLHCLVRGRKGLSDAAYLLVPLAMWAGYELWAERAFGQGFFKQALGYAANEGGQGRGVLRRAGVGLSFLGGCLAPLTLFGALRAGFRWPVWGSWALAWAALAAICHATRGFGLLPPGAAGAQALLSSAHLAFFWLSGATALLSVAKRTRLDDPARALLPVWFFGICAFAIFFNWDVNGRSFLLAAPPLALLAALDAGGQALSRRVLGLLLAGLCLSFALAWADRQWADSLRAEARTLAEEYGANEPKPRFKGHWGFQYYLEKAGLSAYDMRKDQLQPGELLLVAFNTSHSLRPSLDNFELVREDKITPTSWVTITHAKAGAGFHSAIFGVLPYLFGRGEPDLYRVYRARAVVAPIPRKP